jgi:hypothetical protein
MKVNLSTQIEYETRVMLDKYCKENGESIAEITNRAIEKEIGLARKDGAA